MDTEAISKKRTQRKRLLAFTMVALGCIVGERTSVAQTPSDRRVDEAITRGVDYLMSSQAGNGSISNGKHTTAMTAWSVLAMTGAGRTPRDPTREAESMRAAIDFLLRSGRQWGKNWLFTDSPSSAMYEHGMTTLALTEVLALKIDPLRETELRARSQKAVDLIVSAQNNTGGWRYYPNSTDADLSVTIWQLMALRSAQEAKLTVPRPTIDRAVNYVLGCYHVQPPATPSFMYERNKPSRNSYANQVAGLRALQVCGQYNSQPAIDTSARLQGTRPDRAFFYYSLYYYAQALQLNDPDAAQTAYQIVADIALPAQRADGSWYGSSQNFDGIIMQGGMSGEDSLGTIYATTMALISLEVRYHRLPMFKF